MGDIMLNLSAWIERRADNLKPYADHIIHSVKAYEAEIERLRRPEAAQVRVKPIRWVREPSAYEERSKKEHWGAFIDDDRIGGVDSSDQKQWFEDQHERRIRAALEPDTVTDQLSKSVADFVSKQEPLGVEFEQVLADNIEELYDTQPNTAADTVTGWQDIGTAPKDGTWILICHAPFKKRQRIWVDRYDPSMSGGFGRCNDRSFPATHWMPLPPAPEKEG